MGFSLREYNARQREAVERGNGPVLVVSSAGTGKTRLITGRILYLILEKGVAPENILALTFTEKAAQEMVERVDCGLPLGYGEIWIKTFHAFCDSVLRESAFEIGLSADYKLLGEADSWMFLKRHVLDFKLEYYRSLGNPQKFLAAMQQHFSRLKDEDITPEQYVEYAGAALEKVKIMEDVAPPRRGINVVASLRLGLDKENALKYAELANAYRIYDRILAENNCMDFGGLLTNTLRLFERRPSVLKHYRDRFKYILVDEFQDTNFAQNKIVALLAQEHKNLLVVGDDDQSIYKWRGASLTNIRYFEKLFPEAKKIVLNENYRSSQAILDLSYRVIQKNNPNRLEIEQNVDKRLVSAVKCKQNIPEIHHFETLDQEAEFVVSQAKKAVKSGKDTAILVRTNALAEPFLAELKRAAFPFQHFSSQALFAKAGVKDCVALLRVVADPWDDLAMFRLLSMPFFKIKMQDLLELMREAKASGRSFFNLLESGKCGVIKKLLAELIEFSREHSVSEVLGKFFNESGYLREASKAALESDALNAAEHHGLLEDIAAFSEKIKEFEAVHPDKQVADFMAYAQMIEDIGERGGVNKDLDPSAIKILTIHSAKGLEFDSVFMPGLVQGKFPSTNRRDPFEIPRELVQEALPEGDHHLEEERRLFYVGLTRAREFLFITYSDFYDGKKKWKQSLFVAEALESGKAVMKSKKGKTLEISKEQAELPLIQERCARPGRTRPFPEREHRPLKLVLPRLSYSQLDAFRTCPMKYQFRYLFQIPVPMPAVVNFGSSMHNTLRDFYAELQKHPERAGEDLMPFLKEIYEKNWISYGYETRELQKDQKARGLEILARFYEKEKSGFSAAPAFLEKRFVLKIGDVSVAGQIDRIDRLPDGTFEVIDYKTGGQASAKRRPHTSAHLLKQDIDNNLQLSIYALACRDVLKLPVSRLSLYYLEECEKVSTARTDEQLDACAKEILECAKEISESDFSPAPGFHCGYCDYRLVCTEVKVVRAG